MDSDAYPSGAGLSAGAAGAASAPERATPPVSSDQAPPFGAGSSVEPGAGPAEPSPPPGDKTRNPWRWVGEWAAVLVVALAVALAVRAFVVQTFFIPSP